MHTQRRRLLIGAFILLPAFVILFQEGTLKAQITITRDDFSAIVTPGVTTYSLAPDPQVLSVNIGYTGGPHIYDFSTILYQPPNLIRNFFVESIPLLAPRFPSGAVIFGTAADTIENNPVFVVTADTLFQAGNATISDHYRFRHYAPYVTIMPFPLTYGQNFARTGSYKDTTFDLSWQILTSVETVQPANSVVDGYGTLKIPGEEVPCLRIMTYFPEYNEKEVLFMTKSGLLLNIDLSGVDVDTGVVAFDGLGTLSTTKPTSVRASNRLLASCSLRPNYPNPFNPGTTIEYELTSRQFVVLKIFDVCGKEITTLVSGYQEAGAHAVKLDGRGLSSGAYLCRMQAGSFAQTRSLILVK